MHNTPVGILGNGLMGTACARRLAAAGHAVIGYDVDPAKSAALAAFGGTAAASPAEIARTCRTVIIAVFNTDQVEAALEAPDGLLAALPADAPPLTAICVSTCDPDRIAALAQRLPAQRLRFIEMPVSGTSEQTAQGEALGLVGGDPAAAEGVRDVLDVLVGAEVVLDGRQLVVQLPARVARPVDRRVGRDVPDSHLATAGEAVARRVPGPGVP